MARLRRLVNRIRGYTCLLGSPPITDRIDWALSGGRVPLTDELTFDDIGPQRIHHYYDRPWGPGEARRSRLVVIGQQGLDEAAIRAALCA